MFSTPASSRASSFMCARRAKASRCCASTGRNASWVRACSWSPMPLDRWRSEASSAARTAASPTPPPTWSSSRPAGTVSTSAPRLALSGCGPTPLSATRRAWPPRWRWPPPDDHQWMLREVMLGAGFDEVVSPALVPKRLLQRLRLAEGARTLFNPMSDEMDTMRTSLLPSLLSVARYNQNRTAERVDMFELARVYRGKHSDGLADEQIRLTVIARVDADADAGRRGFLRLKSVMDRFAQDLMAGTVRYLRAAPDLYHPGRAATIMVGGREIGVVGELHPSTLAVFDLDGRAVALDVDADALIAARGERKATELPRYPAVQRDIAVVVDANVPAGEIHRTIKEAGGNSLESLRAFDEYRGDQAGEGRKSIAFTLTFRSPERTLTDAEVEKVLSEIRKRLEKKHGARFRK